MQSQFDQTTRLEAARVIRASRERVFEAWTNPARVARWFGPDPSQVLATRLDPRPGGAYRLEIRTQSFGNVRLEGVFLDVEAPSRLVYTWVWQGHPALEFGETLVSVELSAGRDGTVVRVVHDGFRSPEACLDHHCGWNASLERLEAQLNRHAAPEPRP